MDLFLNTKSNFSHTDLKYQSAFLTPSPTDVLMETPSPMDNLPTDLTDSKSNFENPNICNQVREKFMSMISENGNKSVPNSNIVFSSTSEQIVATESGNSQISEEVGPRQDIENVAFSGSVDHSHNNDKNAKVELINLVPDTPVPVNQGRCTLDSLKESSENIDSHSSKRISKSIISESKEIVIVSSSDNSCDIEYILSRNIHNSSKAPKVKEEKEINHKNVSDSVKSPLKHNSQQKIKEFIDGNKNEGMSEGNENKSYVSKVASIKPTILQTPGIIDSSDIEESKNCLKTEFIWVSDSETHRSFGQVVNFKKLNKTRGTQTKSEFSKEAESQKEISMTESEAEDSELSQVDTFVPKRDSHLEIDGKYLKSLVNSKKSPKKLKADEKLKRVENQKSEDDCTVSESEQSIYEESRSVWSGSDLKIKHEDVKNEENFQIIDSGKRTITENRSLINSEKKQRHSNLFQGSLDSFDIGKSTANQSFEYMAKKSRSLELIKQNSLTSKSALTYCSSEIAYEETPRPKSESSQLVTSNNIDEQTDDFCSECCLANDPSSTEIFYTIRSNCSSPLEDSTECDICNSCNLPDAADVLESKMQLLKSKSTCEVCEICGEPATDFEAEEDLMTSSGQEKTGVVDRRVTTLKSLHLSLPKRSFESDEEAILSNQLALEEDRFEIENCGLQGEKGILGYEKISNLESEKTLESEIIVNQESSVHVSKDIMDLQGSGIFVPKDEVVMLIENARRLSRKGSFIKKGVSDRQDKRRYSSADNLQHKFYYRGNDRFFKSKDTKLMASADNIRPMKHFRTRSLRRSSGSIDRLDSSTDNLDCLEESVDNEEEGSKEEITGPEELKRKDSDSLETILLKHGIKLISENETIL